jgi:hypothetical protein
MIERGQAVTRRAHRERWIALSGVLVGIITWSILPGVIVRSLPESWHAPEWMTARIMGVEPAGAGPAVVRISGRSRLCNDTPVRKHSKA